MKTVGTKVSSTKSEFSTTATLFGLQMDSLTAGLYDWNISRLHASAWDN